MLQVVPLFLARIVDFNPFFAAKTLQIWPAVSLLVGYNK